MTITESAATTAKEPGRFYTFPSKVPHGEYFEIRPANLPLNAQPIVDDNLGMCIGYTVTEAPGLWSIYDSDGRYIERYEAPLESPLIDSTDLAD